MLFMASLKRKRIQGYEILRTAKHFAYANKGGVCAKKEEERRKMSKNKLPQTSVCGKMFLLELYQ